MSIGAVRDFIEGNDGEWSEFEDVESLQKRAIEILISNHPEVKLLLDEQSNDSVANINKSDLRSWSEDAIYDAAHEAGFYRLTCDENYIMFGRDSDGSTLGAWLNGSSLIHGDMAFDEDGSDTEWIPEEYGGEMTEGTEQFHDDFYYVNERNWREE